MLFQASHFKSDWHRFNLHQMAKHFNIVTEEEFQHMMEGLFVCLSIVLVL